MEYMFMPLRRYAEFSGRSRRMEYWMWVVFQFLVGILFWVLMMVVGGAALMTGGGPGAMMAAGGSIIIVAALFMLAWLGLIIPGIAVGVRRLHDTNRTGWWLLAPIVPYVFVLVGSAMVRAGSPGAGAAVALVCGIAALLLWLTLLVFMFLDGTRGPNRFGPDPKARASEEVFA
jgi:uncharacterized membrane protein YhaH (DUF805 family)